MKPNTVLVGGLDHAGNPTVVPFQDGTRVEVGDAEIIKLEDSIKDVFLLTLFLHLVKRAFEHYIIYRTNLFRDRW
jgi:hypothetical protein